MANKPFAVSSEMKAVITEDAKSTVAKIEKLEEKLEGYKDHLEKLEIAKECQHARAAMDKYAVVCCPDCGFAWMSWEAK